jgi:hypothetical protein
MHWSSGWRLEDDDLDFPVAFRASKSRCLVRSYRTPTQLAPVLLACMFWFWVWAGRGPAACHAQHGHTAAGASDAVGTGV